MKKLYRIVLVDSEHHKLKLSDSYDENIEDVEQNHRRGVHITSCGYEENSVCTHESDAEIAIPHFKGQKKRMQSKSY